MNGSDIINKILEHTGLTPSVFAKKLGEKRPQRIYDIQTGKTKKLSPEIADKIISAFPDISRTWLLTGEGNMLNEGAATPTPPSDDKVTTVPLLPISAQGGTLNDFVMAVKGLDCEKIISPIGKVDFAITVSGDSMAPEYPSGSQVLIKKINERAFIDWGRTYVLDTCNGTVIKKLMPSDSGDSAVVKCVSINPAYPPFEVNLHDVYGIYRVMLVMAIK